MGTPGQCSCTEPWSNRRGGVKTASLCKNILCHPPCLSIRGPLGTHVPSATLSWWGSFSPPLRDASCSPTTGQDRHRVCPSTSCLKHVRHSSASTWQQVWHCSSDQGMANPRQEEEKAPEDVPKEAPTKSKGLWWKLSRRPNVRPSLKTQKWCGWPTRPTARPIRPPFEQEGSYDLTSVFWQTARDTTLLNTKIHEVQEVWTGWQGLKAANHIAKASQGDIQFFCMVMPNKSPNIMGLKGVHFPEPLCWWGSHSWPWCRKGRMRAGLWTTREPCTAIWTWYVHLCGLFLYQYRHHDVACAHL